MSNIRRVWLIDVGQIPGSKVDEYMTKCINGIRNQMENEDVFVPIRGNSRTRIVELERQVAPGSNEARKHRGFAFRFAGVSEQEEAERHLAHIVGKIKDGTYVLDDGDEKQLFIPMTGNMEVFTL